MGNHIKIKHTNKNTVFMLKNIYLYIIIIYSIQSLKIMTLLR